MEKTICEENCEFEIIEKEDLEVVIEDLAIIYENGD